MTKTNILKNGIIPSILIGFVGGMALFGALLPQVAIGEIKDPNSKFCSEPTVQQSVVKTIKMVVTAYSSTPDQTDDTPFTTASGKQVADGIVANNLLPFGTKIRIPELYGNKVFVVEDRMNQRKGKYHMDIWFGDYKQAKNFGAAYNIKIEVLES